MRLISKINEIRENITTMESYLTSGDEEKREYAINLIKKGTCFIAYKSGKRMRFVPSRFIGYVKNTISRHESNYRGDGRDTNPAISIALGVKLLIDNQDLEELYKQYCTYLGFSPRKTGSFGVKRKYWMLP